MDCIIDGNIGHDVDPFEDDPPPRTRVDTAGNIQTSTILGTTKLHSLDASESIFDGIVQIRRRQIGCIRFSHVLRKEVKGEPPLEKVYLSQTPRRYRCQPDLALTGVTDESLKECIRSRLRSVYTSRIYGKPEYAQLSLTCAEEIRTGAEDGSEMGVFNHLKQPQREANLREALNEYLRFGLEAGIFYVT